MENRDHVRILLAGKRGDDRRVGIENDLKSRTLTAVAGEDQVRECRGRGRGRGRTRYGKWIRRASRQGMVESIGVSGGVNLLISLILH